MAALPWAARGACWMFARVSSMMERRRGPLDEPRFRMRWRLGAKLGLVAASIAAAVLAAATLAGFAQLRMTASEAAWKGLERPLQAIVGRLEARQEQIASALAPQARGDASAAREAVRAAGRDVLAGLQLLERGGANPRVAEVDAQLALLTRELQELEREADAAAAGGGARAAQQRAASLGDQVRRLRRGIEALSVEDAQTAPELLTVIAAAIAALALVAGVPILIALAVGAGGRARGLARTVDEMAFCVRAGDPPVLPETPTASDEIGYLAFSLGGLAQSLQGTVAQAQQLAAELEEAAGHDPLTGALSRQRFQQVLEAELARSRRYKGALTLVIFNVDALAAVNEKYGSEQGDYVLSTIADLVRFNVRKTDHFVRWGGGEFVLLLPETGIDGARHLAEKLRRNIEVHPFDRIGRVTMSAGVTELAEGDTRDSFVSRADDAMRRAKSRGRNRVVAAAAPAAAPPPPTRAQA